MSDFDPKTAIEPLLPPGAEFLEDRPRNRDLDEPRSFAPTGRVRQGRPGEVLARWPAAWEEIPAERFIRLPAADAADVAEARTVVEPDLARDRALIGMMVYSFARVGATVAMKGGDLFQHRKQLWLQLHEKGGKRHEVPCHPELEGYLTAWAKAAGISRDKKTPLFRSIGKGERLSEKALSRFDVFHMIKRRAKAASLPYSTCCHTFRATGITTYLENGGTLEHAQTIADHESPRTTKLYDRTREELTAEEIGRIKI